MFDKWMYVLKNLSRLMERPAALQERIFTKLFEQAEIARFNAEDLKEYEDSVNAYRDILNAIKTAERIKYVEGESRGKSRRPRKEKQWASKKENNGNPRRKRPTQPGSRQEPAGHGYPHPCHYKRLGFPPKILPNSKTGIIMSKAQTIICAIKKIYRKKQPDKIQLLLSV